MAWGGRASIDRMNYQYCVKAVASARDRSAGKPIGSIRVFDRGSHYAVRQYSTDIVRYYEDGSFAVCTNYPSASKLNAIGCLTNAWVTNRSLPTFNGRKSDTDKHYEIQGVVFSGINGYLRFDKDGVVDKSTVLPIDIQVIDNIPEIRIVQKRAKELAVQIELRRRLGIEGNRRVNPYSWLKENIRNSDNEVNYENSPDQLDLSEIKPFWFAQLANATKTIQFKEFA